MSRASELSDQPTRPSLETRPEGNKEVALLALAAPVLVGMMAVAIAPGMLQMARTFGALTAQLVLTVPALMMILGATLAGFMSERWGRRAVIAASLVIYAIAGVAGAAAGTLGELVATRVVIGFVGGVLLTSVYAAIGEYFEGQARERLLGFMSMAGSTVALLLLVGMGFVVQRFGWRAPFFIYAVALIFVPVALRGLHRKKSSAGALLGWRPVGAQAPIYLLLCFYTIGMYMMIIQGPFLLEGKAITAPSAIGSLVGLSSIIGAVGGAFYGMLRRVLGFRQMFIFISVAIGSGLILAAWAPGGPTIILSMIVTGLGIGIIEPTVASELLTRTPEPLHDRVMGVNVAAMFLGQFINPLILAPVRQTLGINPTFSIVGVVYIAAAILFFLSLFTRLPKMRPRPSVAN
jgi:MFS family permease